MGCSVGSVHGYLKKAQKAAE